MCNKSRYNSQYKMLVLNIYSENNKKNTLKLSGISNGSLYNWKNKKDNGYNLDNKKKKSKISSVIKCYIRTYVIKRVCFNYLKLIELIKREFIPFPK